VLHTRQKLHDTPQDYQHRSRSIIFFICHHLLPSKNSLDYMLTLLKQEDNDDYCSSCGGNGGLVCCDGCTRSFHYQCVDPPMIESALPDDPWFCNVCQSSRQPPPPDSESRGAFGDLLVRLSERNPSAFQLPQDIRDYFDGVRTGGEGEYEDVVPPKTRYDQCYQYRIDY